MRVLGIDEAQQRPAETVEDSEHGGFPEPDESTR
jgi:hypothetical protein